MCGSMKSKFSKDVKKKALFLKNLDIRYEFVSVGIVDTIWKLVLYLRIYFTWSNSNTDLTWNYLTTICLNNYGVNLKYKNWNIEIVGFWQTWNYRIMKGSCSKPRLCYWPVVSSLLSFPSQQVLILRHDGSVPCISPSRSVRGTLVSAGGCHSAKVLSHVDDINMTSFKIASSRF